MWYGICFRESVHIFYLLKVISVLLNHVNIWFIMDKLCYTWCVMTKYIFFINIYDMGSAIGDILLIIWSGCWVTLGYFISLSLEDVTFAHSVFENLHL